MSPSGQTLPLTPDTPRNNKDLNTTIRNNNNTALLRRVSLVEAKCPSKEPMLTVVLCDEEKKKSNLPDVLPINAKVSSTRSHFIDDKERLNTPPHSPQNSPVNTLQKSPIKSFSLLKPEPQPIKPYLESPPIKSKPGSPIKFHQPDSPPIKTYPESQIRTSNPNSPPIRTSNSRTFKPDSPPMKFSVKPRSPNLQSRESISDSALMIRAVQVGDIIEQPKVIEGLQLIQRTEVTLRVNTCTIDAASQTENENDMTPLPTRRKLQEEIECEKLSQDLVNYLSPSDRLKGILGEILFIRL